jgi:hypothetical protein
VSKFMWHRQAHCLEPYISLWSLCPVSRTTGPKECQVWFVGTDPALNSSYSTGVQDSWLFVSSTTSFSTNGEAG